MQNGKKILLALGCIGINSSELDTVLETLSQKYGITITQEELEKQIVELKQHRKIEQVRELTSVPPITILPNDVRASPKTKQYIPKTVQKPVKRPQKPQYKYRRR